MIRVEVNFRQELWSTILWKIQLSLNVTRQKSTQYSPLNLLIGSEVATPVIRSLVRDVSIEGSSPNREALREIARQRAAELLEQNQVRQDTRVNERRKPPRSFALHDVVFVHKNSQSSGKMDSGMRGPYKVTKILPHGRYDLKLLAGSYGKTTQAGAEYMTLWRGEWTPEVCSAYFECDEMPADDAEAGPSNLQSHLAEASTSSGEDAPTSGEAVLEKISTPEGVASD